MSKKINLAVPIGKERPNLKSLFNKYIKRKRSEISKKMAVYYRLFPFLSQWAIDEEDVEMVLRYYGYLDKHGNIFLNPNTSDNMGMEDYFDDYEEVFPGKDDELEPEDYWADLESDYRRRFNEKGKKKHTKNRSRHKSKGAKIVSINTPYSGHEENPDEVDEDDSSIVQYIYYYPDYNDKTDKLEFNDLKSFDKFCERNGFFVNPFVAERIAYRPVSHCCLNPASKLKDVDELIAEESYADMRYEATDAYSMISR